MRCVLHAKICTLISIEFSIWLYFDLVTLFFLMLGKRLIVPEGCDLLAAGALPVAFGTSHVALVHRAQLKVGQVLTHLSFVFSCTKN